jgi:probable HAF family extracellular repeat protein
MEAQVMHRKAVFASLVLVFTGQALGQEASLVGIGDLIGGEYVSRGRAISADGRTVVGDSSSFRGYWGEPAVWTADRGLFGIGLLDQDTQGGANGVSPDGRWVVGSSRRGTRSEAFLWSEGTGMVGLGDLQSGAFRSSAMGVSADGGVVVGYGNVWRDGGERSEAFRWTPGGGMEGLGSLGGPVRQSHAYDVSADGSVIVGSSSSDDGGGAFRWTADTGMVALDVLDDRLPSGAAWSVSHEGDWAAGEALRYNRDGRRETHAVRWGPDGAVEWLGFPNGVESWQQYMRARAISGNGRVVVGEAYSADPDWGQGEQAFIWTEDWGMRRLVDVLADYGVDYRALGWNSLDQAYGISADGRTITGEGARHGLGAEGFVVTLPIPAPGSAALLGAAALLGTRRRR